MLNTINLNLKIKKWIEEFDFIKFHQIRVLTWVGFTCFFLGLFVKMTWELYEDSSIDSLDHQILINIARFRSPTISGAAVDITSLGSPTLLTIFTIVSVIIFWLKKDRIGYTYLASGSIGAGLGTFLVKHLFNRERPSIIPRLIEVSGFSYPSGHSFGATSFYLTLMFLIWRHFQSLRDRFIILFFTLLLILFVCFSRLYLGVHYPSDVLSGFFLGAAWVCLLTTFFSSSAITFQNRADQSKTKN